MALSEAHLLSMYLYMADSIRSDKRVHPGRTGCLDYHNGLSFLVKPTNINGRPLPMARTGTIPMTGLGLWMVCMVLYVFGKSASPSLRYF